jgi:hypothetical protein
MSTYFNYCVDCVHSRKPEQLEFIPGDYTPYLRCTHKEAYIRTDPVYKINEYHTCKRIRTAYPSRCPFYVEKPVEAIQV